MATDHEISLERQRIQTGEDTHSVIARPVILESWLRSREYGVPLENADKRLLSEEALQARIAARADFCKIAFSFIESLYDFTRGTGFLITISDEDGYVLRALGDPEITQKGSNNGLAAGCNRSEKRFGTSGIGTSLAIRKPVQIFGNEHYYPLHYDWACSSAPIFYPDKSVAGAICLIGTTAQVTIHTLGMAVSAADAIGRQLTMKVAYDELDRAQSNIKTMLEAWPSGILLLGRDMEVLQTNDRALQMIGLPREQLIGIPIPDALPGNDITTEQLQNGLSNRNIIIKKDGQSVRFLLSVRNNGMHEYVVLLEQAEALHKKVNRIVGAAAHFSFDDIVGKSAAVMQAVKLGKLAAQNDANVFLWGESGTGKELFAQSIHNASDRRDGPFIAINCGALPKSLIESELFGYEGGSFTGARKEGAAGKFELANGGTIFLDELGDMPYDVQVTLLRVLQTREISRLGSNRTTRIDVRVITATNQDLEALVAEKMFREDLYYRINVLSIKIPPLRMRQGDIRLLADHFLEKYAASTARARALHFSEEAYAALEGYTWPGNVRQLENTIERAVCMCTENRITPDCLPVTYSSHGAGAGAVSEFADALPAEEPGEKRDITTIRELEREQIETALKKTNGQVSKAAELLGISRRTIYRKIDQYQIEHR